MHFSCLIFSTEEKLRAAMTLAAAPFESIKKIDDEHDFLSSIPEYVGDVRIRIIVDPYLTEKSTMRFTEIVREIPVPQTIFGSEVTTSGKSIQGLLNEIIGQRYAEFVLYAFFDGRYTGILG